jgi:hypothetical protein
MKAHPLEETFDIAPVVNDYDVIEYEQKDIIIGHSYDEKDTSLDGEFDTVFQKAIHAYDSMSEEMEIVEGKYKARVGEVSNQFLSTALNAAKEKMNLKQHKDKLVVKEAGSGVTNNNLFVGSHEELLKVLQEAKGDRG